MVWFTDKGFDIQTRGLVYKKKFALQPQSAKQSWTGIGPVLDTEIYNGPTLGSPFFSESKLDQ